MWEGIVELLKSIHKITGSCLSGLATFLPDGYADHLAQLTSHGGSRPAQVIQFSEIKRQKMKKEWIFTINLVPIYMEMAKSKKRMTCITCYKYFSYFWKGLHLVICGCYYGLELMSWKPHSVDYFSWVIQFIHSVPTNILLVASVVILQTLWL